MASSFVMGAGGPALGKGPPPPRVSTHLRICAIILHIHYFRMRLHAGPSGTHTVAAVDLHITASPACRLAGDLCEIAGRTESCKAIAESRFA